MKKLFNNVKKFFEKRRINKEKYGAQRPRFAIFNKEKKKKIREANKNYFNAWTKYNTKRKEIKKTIDKYRVNADAIEDCCAVSKSIGNKPFERQVIIDLLEEQREHISILKKQQEELLGPIKERLEECCWINRVKMLKNECFNLWNIKNEKIISRLQDDIMSNYERELDTNNLDLLDEEKKNKDNILADTTTLVESDNLSNISIDLMSDKEKDRAAIKELQSKYKDDSLTKKTKRVDSSDEK